MSTSGALRKHSGPGGGGGKGGDNHGGWGGGGVQHHTIYCVYESIYLFVIENRKYNIV